MSERNVDQGRRGRRPRAGTLAGPHAKSPGDARARVAPGAARYAAALALAAFICAGITINLSWIHEHHDADSLLPVLISLDRYLPFYWGQDRYGMLVPLLASFVRDYQLNLFVQTQFLVFAPLLIVLLWHLYFQPRDAQTGLNPKNIGSALVSICLLIPMFQPTKRMSQAWLLAHPYLISLAFLLCAVALAYRADGGFPKLRYAGAGLLVVLALWINTFHVALAAALFALVPVRHRPFRATYALRAGMVVVAVLSTLLVYVISAPYRTPYTYAAMLPLSEAPAALAALSRNLFAEVLYGWRVAMLAALAAALAFLNRPRAAHPRSSMQLVIAAPAVGMGIGVAMLEWVKTSSYEPRYWTTPVALLLIILAGAVAARIMNSGARSMGSSARACVGGSVVLLILVTLAFGRPSVAAARARLDRFTAPDAQEAKALGCTHMLGDYWTIWRTVFHDRVHDPDTPLHAVGFRAEAVRDIWNGVPEKSRVYCGKCSDPLVDRYRNHFGLPPLEASAQAGSLCVMTPVLPN
jgi:hypothetical protein